jgi:hypothetical protein
VTPPSASRLVTLTAIVVALLAAIGITGGKRAMVERPLIAPGLSPADVTFIRIDRNDEPSIGIDLGEGSSHSRGSLTEPYVVGPVPGPADDAVVHDLLSAIATARADRSVPIDAVRKSAGLETPTLVIRLDRRPKESIEIARGAAVTASGQVWLGVDRRAFLVPGWVAAALDRNLASLRRRQVFPRVQINGIEIHGRGVDLVLAGVPLYRLDEGTRVRMAGPALVRLDMYLRAVVVDILRTGDTSTTELTVRVLGGPTPYELTVHGPCPGIAEYVLVGGSAGVGCVRSSLVDGIVAAAVHLTTPAAMERALAVGGETYVQSIQISGGDVLLARRGAGWILSLGAERDDADDDAVDSFFDALATPGTPGPIPDGRPTASWTVTLDTGTVETWHWYLRAGDAAPVVRRDEEPNAIVLSADAAAAFRKLGPPLRNLSLLVIDASTINAIRATGANPASLTRGQLVGEWDPAATPEVAKIVDMLATFRGLRWLEARELGAIRRTLTFSIDAPPIPGEPATTHTIAIGAARPGGLCAVRVDAHLPVELSAAQCAALLAPLAR